MLPTGMLTGEEMPKGQHTIHDKHSHSMGVLSSATSAHLIWEWKLAWFHFAGSLNSREWRKPGHLLKVG